MDTSHEQPEQPVLPKWGAQQQVKSSTPGEGCLWLKDCHGVHTPPSHSLSQNRTTALSSCSNRREMLPCYPLAEKISFCLLFHLHLFCLLILCVCWPGQIPFNIFQPEMDYYIQQPHPLDFREERRLLLCFHASFSLSSFSPAAFWNTQWPHCIPQKPLTIAAHIHTQQLCPSPVQLAAHWPKSPTRTCFCKTMLPTSYLALGPY